MNQQIFARFNKLLIIVVPTWLEMLKIKFINELEINMISLKLKAKKQNVLFINRIILRIYKKSLSHLINNNFL